MAATAPARFRSLFSAALLATHRGYDPGALAAARDFAAATGAPLFYSTISRLLVELNRPLGHPQVFSVAFPEATRAALLRRYYFPYWKAVEARVARACGCCTTAPIEAPTPASSTPCGKSWAAATSASRSRSTRSSRAMMRAAGARCVPFSQTVLIASGAQRRIPRESSSASGGTDRGMDGPDRRVRLFHQLQLVQGRVHREVR